MAVENLVALYVEDNDQYDLYREKMFPILQKYNGGFGYDFKISEVLRSEVNKPLNRVFTIYFENEFAMNSFFEDEDYLIIKKAHFSDSVSSVVEIAKYESSK